MHYWVNTETGELLSYDKAWTQFIKDYDGGDTEIIKFLDIEKFLGIFTLTNIKIVP